MITIDTERLTIRNFCPGDWHQLQELAVHYAATQWAQYEPPWPTSDEGVQGMADWFSRGDEYLAACLKATGTLIGLIAIERREGPEQRIHNLGYVFHPAYHGHGYATEGCRAVMRYLFEQLRADGIVSLDMGLGDFDYKLDWTDRTVVYDAVIPLTLKGRLGAAAILAARRHECTSTAWLDGERLEARTGTR